MRIREAGHTSRGNLGRIVRPYAAGFVRAALSAGAGGNAFDDNFEVDGALSSPRWLTYNGAAVSVEKAGGLLQMDVEDTGANESLWFGGAQGRLDYQQPGAGPWRFEAYDVGPAVLNAPGTPLTFAANDFQFAGIIYHHPTLSTVTYQACMAGHRNGQAQFTIEIKNTNAGTSTTRDEGDDIHTGLADLAIEKAAGSTGAITWQYRVGGGSWVTATNAGNIPANDEDWVVGLASYRFDGFKRDFTGRFGGWAKVL